ncbi:hypothetical protein BS47DRAFT_506709 [Hydnum rufescens UP504]|uniref:Uncharacterized protein n=1 Tax=Hydnum rufescens UP504 TaxID=1448309 RepID=A0A9P6B4W2_9AGAM|nr:hypothetical protein BS47DRAFT_506709 [Hydnum rufescens UP504]
MELDQVVAPNSEPTPTGTSPPFSPPFPSRSPSPTPPSPPSPVPFLPQARPISPFGTLRGNALAEARSAAAKSPPPEAALPSNHQIHQPILEVDEYRTWDARLLRSVIQLGNDLGIDEWLALGNQEDQSSAPEPDLQFPPLPPAHVASPRSTASKSSLRSRVDQRSSASTFSSTSTSLAPSSISTRTRAHPRHSPQSFTDESGSSEHDFEHLFQVLSMAAQDTDLPKADRSAHRNSSSQLHPRANTDAGPSQDRTVRRPRAISSGAGTSRPDRFSSRSAPPLPSIPRASSSDIHLPMNPQQLTIPPNPGPSRVRKKRAYTTVSSVPTTPVSPSFPLDMPQQSGPSRSTTARPSSKHGSRPDDPTPTYSCECKSFQLTFQCDHVKSQHWHQLTLS